MTTRSCPLCGSARAREAAVTRDGQVVRCLECRLLYRHPPPVEALRRHYEHVYDDDSTSDHIDERRRAVFDGFLAERRPVGGGRLLDVGCGSGEFLALARARGWSVDGVEVSERGTALARRRGLTVHGAVADLAGAAYDVVTLWNVIDFFTRPVEQMREIHRVLAPGGITVVRAPNAAFQLAAWRLSRVLVWPAPLARLVTDAYFFQPLVWSPRTLRRLLDDAGFTGVHVWNSDVSAGDPYRTGSPGRDQVVTLVKHSLRAVAQVVAAGSRHRLLIGSSISARGHKL